jgi:hypothetical protein
VQEYEKRFETWLDNLRFVREYNAKHASHWVGDRLPPPPLTTAAVTLQECSADWSDWHTLNLPPSRLPPSFIPRCSWA